MDAAAESGRNLVSEEAPLLYILLLQLHGLLQYYSYYSLSVGNERANADGTAEPALRETKFLGANTTWTGEIYFFLFSWTARGARLATTTIYFIHNTCINARLRWYFQHAHFIQLVGVGQGRRTWIGPWWWVIPAKAVHTLLLLELLVDYWPYSSVDSRQYAWSSHIAEYGSTG